MSRILSTLIAWLVLATGPACAQELITKKQVFELASFKTQSGRTLKGVKVGWESYGTLNAEKSNAILICHFYSGTSHAAGRYAEREKISGYWDAIIGQGKAIDTSKYFVLSADTLANLNVGDPNVTTTGPASTDPDTGKQYGMNFPVVTIRDFVEVQRNLIEHLGISKLVMVAGASMGGLQTYEWAAAYPAMVGKAMPVIASAEVDPGLIAWLGIWAAPIRLDPKWNNGDYYDNEPPLAGLAQALKIVTLQSQTNEWANATFGAKWAKDSDDPLRGFDVRYAIEAALDNIAAARAKASDANSFLYLIKANQLFADGAAERAKAIKAPTLLIYSPKDQVFGPESIRQTAATLKANGVAVELLALEGNRGHLDGVLSIKQAEKTIASFLTR
jgi:homoserine O-acetyltransferase